MASKKTKRSEQAKKVYMSASLITVGDDVIRPGDIVNGLTDADEKMYLDAGMIYPVDGIIPPEDNQEDDDVPPENKKEEDTTPPSDNREADENKEAGEA